MRVLIADDQREVGLSLADMVRYCGHEIVAVVSSGLDAINTYSRLHPDLVLMDYRMPKLNGGTACRHILAKDPDARVILVSGWSPGDGADQSGALSFLPKPVDLNRLNATLQSVVQMLPPLSPAEMPMPEIYYPPESIDYSQPVEPTAEPLPIVAESSPFVLPSSELVFPIEAPRIDLQQTMEVVEAGNASPARTSPAKELVEEKKSRKPHGNRRSAQRARAG
jgi:two-component system chemotaxis response regulator CheY